MSLQSVHSQQTGQIRCENFCFSLCKEYVHIKFRGVHWQTTRWESFSTFQYCGRRCFENGQKPIEGTNRNVMGDNWFTSISLTECLLTQKKLTYVGTIRQIKRKIPQEFRPNAQREIYSSLFGFRKDDTCILLP